MISFLAVMTLSFTTLYLGTYVADRVEAAAAPLATKPSTSLGAAGSSSRNSSSSPLNL